MRFGTVLTAQTWVGGGDKTRLQQTEKVSWAEAEPPPKIYRRQQDEHNDPLDVRKAFKCHKISELTCLLRCSGSSPRPADSTLFFVQLKKKNKKCCWEHSSCLTPSLRLFTVPSAEKQIHYHHTVSSILLWTSSGAFVQSASSAFFMSQLPVGTFKSQKDYVYVSP